MGVETEGAGLGGVLLGRWCLDKLHHSLQAEMMCTSSCTFSEFIRRRSTGALRGEHQCSVRAVWG